MSDMKTRITVYRNVRNENKYIEVHEDGYGHRTVRQFMRWGNVKNLLGDRCLHRWKKSNLKDLLNEYVMV